MAMLQNNPLSEVRSLMRRVEQAFEPLTTWRPAWEREAIPFGMEAVPPVDIFEDKEEVIIRADVPGLDQKELEVLLEDSTLTLRGQRKLYKEDRKENYQRIESAYGAFSRTFSMPSTIDRDKLRADLKNGVLEVHIPKREGAKGKMIHINA